MRCQGGFWAGAEFWFSAFPVVLHLQYSPRPIHFPGWIPNSVVLQQMWLPGEIGGPGALSQLTSVGTLKARRGAGRLPEVGSRGSAGGAKASQLVSGHLCSSLLQPGGSQDDLWLQRRWGKRRHTKWSQKLIQWLGEEEGEGEGEDQEQDEEEGEDEDQELDLDWASDSLTPQTQLSTELLESEEPAAQVGAPGRAALGGDGPERWVL